MRVTANRTAAIVAAGLLGAFCAAPSVGAAADAADAESFEEAFAAAQAARKEAASVGFEWRDTKKLLWYAKQYAERGYYEKAQELALQAKRQGELAVEQAKIQEKAWKDAVLR